jgi:predicted O-methyltransferase YrrM
MLLPWRDVPVGATSISTSLTDAEADALYGLATAARVLEVGSAYGYSAVRMAASAWRVLAVDPHLELDSLQSMRANLVRYDRRRVVSILLAGSERALPMLAGVGARFDLVFIDGEHSEQAVCHDLTWAAKLLAPDGVVACHDYGEDTCPAVCRVLDREYPQGPDFLIDTLWVRRGR